MDLIHQHKLNRYRTIHTICTEYQSDWDHLPAFVACYEAFSARLLELEERYYLQDMLMLGVTPERDRLLRQTIDRADKMADTLKAYARLTGNVQLTMQIGFSKNAYLQHGNRHLLQLIGRIVDTAVAHTAVLGNNGLWQQHIDELQALKTALLESIGAAEAAVPDNAQQTIAALHAEIETLLGTRLDELVHALRPFAPAFRKEYADARTTRSITNTL